MDGYDYSRCLAWLIICQSQYSIRFVQAFSVSRLQSHSLSQACQRRLMQSLQRPLTMSDLKERVEVNWRPDLDSIKSDPSCNQVIWVSNDPDREIYMMSSNEIISRYLVSVDLESQ